MAFESLLSAKCMHWLSFHWVFCNVSRDHCIAIEWLNMNEQDEPDVVEVQYVHRVNVFIRTFVKLGVNNCRC